MLDLITTILGGHLKAQARRGSAIGGLAAFAVLLTLVGLAFAIAALRTWLAMRYDSITADLILCGGFLLVAATFASAAKIVSTRPPPPDPSTALTGALAPMALGILAQWLKPQAGAPPRASRPARAADVETQARPGSPPTDAPPAETVHGAANLGGVALAILPALVIGLLLGRKSKS